MYVRYCFKIRENHQPPPRPPNSAANSHKKWEFGKNPFFFWGGGEGGKAFWGNHVQIEGRGKIFFFFASQIFALLFFEKKKKKKRLLLFPVPLVPRPPPFFPKIRA